MSKELQAFRDILGILSAVSGCEVDMNSERIITVQQALKRLESIDNAEPSEALNVLKATEKYTGIDLTVVKNALLKAQEPKHYLKWEDLVFKEKTQKMKVKLEDSLYRISWDTDGSGANMVFIYKYITNDYLEYCTYISDNRKQFFNDLHLERVD